MNTKLELTREEMEMVIGGNVSDGIQSGSTIGAFAGSVAGLGVWGILAGAALIVTAPVSVTMLGAVGAGAAVGAIVGSGIGMYYSS